MVVCDHDRCLARGNGDDTGLPWKVLGCGHSYHDVCIGDKKCNKCHNFLSHRIAQLAESFNGSLLSDDDKDADRNEEDTSQDFLLDDEIGHNNVDEIPIGHTTTPILDDLEGLELFRFELSKRFDTIT